MAKKKIVFLIASLDSGGAERMTAFLVNQLPSASFEKVLLVVNNKTPHYTINEDVKVIDCQKPQIKSSLMDIYLTIKHENPDIVFSTLTAINLFVVAIKFLLPSHIKFIVRESSILSINNQQTSRPWLWNFLVSLIYPSCDLIVAQSIAMKEDMIQNYGLSSTQIHQIYNPLNPEHFKIGDQVDANEFVTVGNLRPEKGYLRMLDVLALLKIDFHYTIVGEGPMRSELEAKIKKLGLEGKVTLAGKQNDPARYLIKSKLYLQTSLYEGFPNALLEAGACGVPVIAFDVPGGTAEIIENEVNGYLIQNDQLDAFARAIEHAVDISFDKVKMRNYILQKFNQQVILDQYLQLMFDEGSRG